MKLSERIKNKKKFIIGVVIGIVVVNIIGIAGAIAASVTSDVVLYDSPTGKKNVKDAIDELYTMSSTHCPDGQICYQNGVIGPTGARTQPLTIYLDPTNLSTVCNSYNSVSITGTSSGCMKWYVYKEDSNYYYAILDHNITEKGSGFSVAQTQVTADALGWVSSLNPRSITADEIAEITGNTNFNQSTATTSDYFYFDSNSTTRTATTQGVSKYAWLYENLSSCTYYGCNTAADLVNISGYYTSDIVAASSGWVWVVDFYGRLDFNNKTNSSFYVRPVISIAKS